MRKKHVPTPLAAALAAHSALGIRLEKCNLNREARYACAACTADGYCASTSHLCEINGIAVVNDPEDVRLLADAIKFPGGIK